jgi:nucleoside-diphosphate-sugar epimerase
MMRHLHPSPAPPARTVVIGAAGFVGGAVMRRLASAGAPALGLTRGEIDLLADDAGERLEALLQQGDAVVAVAARAPCKNAELFLDNARIVRGLVAGLKRAAISHLVNISSDAVYGDEPVPLSEALAPAPASLHGAMHLAREIALSGEIDAPIAHIRPTLVYGAADPHNGYGPNQFRRKANRGEPIVLFGEGEERRDHVAVEDVAELVWRVLAHRSVGVLNAATGVVTSFREVAETAVALSGRPVEIKGSPRKGPMPHNGYRPFDPSATASAFPDFRYTPLSDGLAQAQAAEFGAAATRGSQG